MPSHLYYDKTEGLCGSCNGDSTDDMATPDGNIPTDAVEFVKSWKANGTGDYHYRLFAGKAHEAMCKNVHAFTVLFV